MNSLFKNALLKLKNVRGESITEVLVAVLISGLAILMLATVIATAMNTNKASRTAIEGYYAANNALVESGGTTSTGSIKLLTVKGDASTAVVLRSGTSDNTIIPVTYSVGMQSGDITVVSYITS